MIPRALRNPLSEANEQLVTIRHLQIYYPDCLFTISPNGMKLPISVAVLFKLLGYRKGTSDILIFEARKGYNGLFIEMKKRKGGKRSDDQKKFCQDALDRGYKAVIAQGSQIAIAFIEDYLGPSKKIDIGAALGKK